MNVGKVLYCHNAASQILRRAGVLDLREGEMTFTKK